MNKTELLEGFKFGWYAKKIALENTEKFRDLFGDRPMHGDKIIALVREQFFAESECQELALCIKGGNCGDEKSFRLCEAVFSESLASQSKQRATKVILSRMKNECEGLEVDQISEFIKFQIEELGGATFVQLAACPFVKKTAVVERGDVCVE